MGIVNSKSARDAAAFSPVLRGPFFLYIHIKVITSERIIFSPLSGYLFTSSSWANFFVYNS